MGSAPSGQLLRRVAPSKDGMKIVEGYEKIKAEYPDYLKDESNMGEGKADILFFPKSKQNIVWIIDKAREQGKSITISGGRTGICGGSVPEADWLVSLDRMKKVIDLNCELKTNDEPYVLITLEPGVRLNEIAQMLKEYDFNISNKCIDEMKKSKLKFFYPPDPTETTATIGGTVATNASGARTLKYGPTRNFIYGLDVVLPNGYLLSIKRGDIISKNGFFYLKGDDIIMEIPAPSYKIPNTKHSAAFFSSEPMDIIDLFIGSEGVLGIISSITIKVILEPEYIVSGIAFFTDENDVVAFVEDSRINLKDVACLEYFDMAAISLLKNLQKEQGPVSEIPDLPDLVMGVYFETFANEIKMVKESLIEWEREIEKSHGLIDLSLASIDSKDLNRFKIIRHSIPEMINRKISEIKKKIPSIHKVGTDMAVPDGYLRAMLSYYRGLLDQSGIEYIIFGHIGNNHLHVNMIPKDEIEMKKAENLYMKFAERAVEFNGSVSGEHGIGKLKKRYLEVQFSKKEIEEMKKIKAIVDPENILNRGNLFD